MNSIKRLVYAAFVIVNFVYSNAYGQETQALVIDNPIAVARQFAEQNQFEQATVILEALIASPDASQQFFYIEANFLLASIMIRQQNFEQAKLLYQNILAVDPGHTAARIELAGIFRREENHELAVFHLELADVSNLPDQLQSRISDYMTWTRRREGWSFRTNFAVMPDTNINSATESDSVRIYGWEFNLSEDAQQTSGIGLRLGGGTSYTKAVGARNFIDFRLDGNYIFYPKNSNFDQGLAIAKAGPRHQFNKNNEVSIYAQTYYQMFGGKSYSNGYGVESSYTTRLNSKQIAQFKLSSYKIDNDFDENRNGHSYTADASFRQYFTERGYLNFFAAIGLNDLSSKALSSLTYNLGAGVYYQFEEGISLYVYPAFSKMDYKELWGAFGVKRKDKRYSLSVNITKRDLQLFGFAPVIGLTVVKNNSNIDLFNHTRFRSELSFTRYF